LLTEETVTEELGDATVVNDVTPGKMVVGPTVVEEGEVDATSPPVDERAELVADPLDAVGGGVALEAFVAGVASGTSVVFLVSGVVDKPHELAGFVRAPP